MIKDGLIDRPFRVLIRQGGLGESGPPFKVDGVSSSANEKGQPFLVALSSARDETRTHTGFTPLAPETSASTISPPALWDCKYSNFLEIRARFPYFPSPCTYSGVFVHGIPYLGQSVHIFPSFCARGVDIAMVGARFRAILFTNGRKLVVRCPKQGNFVHGREIISG